MCRVILLCLCLTCILLPAETSLDELERLARQYIQLGQTKQDELRAWQQQQQQLAQDRQTAADQLATLQRQLEQLQQDIQTQQQQLHDLQQQRATLQTQTDALTRQLDLQARHLRTFLDQLAEPLRQPFLPLLHDLQHHDSPLRRLQAALNASLLLDKQQRALTRASVVIDQRECKAVFFGCAYAVALSADATQAAVGRPAPQGWVWQPAPQHRPALQQFFAILEQQVPPQLVDVPVPPPATVAQTQP